MYKFQGTVFKITILITGFDCLRNHFHAGDFVNERNYVNGFVALSQILQA